MGDCAAPVRISPLVVGTLTCPKNQAAGLCCHLPVLEGLCIPVGMDWGVLQSVSLEIWGGVCKCELKTWKSVRGDSAGSAAAS